VTDRSFVMQ